MAHILVAEHNKTVSSYIYAALKKSGHSVEIVDNALDAWAALARNQHDVMILNVVMPGIDSFILAQRALQENPLVQIVFVTGFAAVAMDTFTTPSYAPAPFTTHPFHLKDIGNRVGYLMGQGYYSEVQSAANTETADTVIYADFVGKTFDRSNMQNAGAQN
jgi:two-component system cell cycle response regulator CpdR